MMNIKNVIKQLKKKLFDSKKSGYLDDDDEEYRGIRDLEYMFEEASENDEDYYKLEIVRNALRVIMVNIIIGYMKVEEVNIMNH